MTIRTDRSLTLFLLLWPLIAATIAFSYPFSFLVSILLFFVPVTTVLAFRVPRLLPRAFAFAVLLSVGVVAAVDTIAHASKAWFAMSAFDVRFLGLAPWEDLLLGIVLTTGLLLFYEWHEQPRHRARVRTAQWFRFAAFIALLVIAVTVAWHRDPGLLIVSHPFLKLGIAAIVIPVVIDVSRHRSLTAKFLRTTLYWAYALFAYELAGVHQGWWTFPGDAYVGWLSIGTLAFPLDELLFWVCGIAAGGLTYYEYFIDDNR